MDGLIKAGGIYSSLLVLFHLLFWKIFDWKEELSRLNRVNRAVMQVLNLSLTFAFAIIAYVSFTHTGELLATALGHTLIGLIASLWLFRSVLQIIFFKLEHWLSWVFLVYFLAGGAMYGIPFLYNT